MLKTNKQTNKQSQNKTKNKNKTTTTTTTKTNKQNKKQTKQKQKTKTKELYDTYVCIRKAENFKSFFALSIDFIWSQHWNQSNVRYE